MRSSDPTAFVSTFYSFKGGVGRSMLLANVGALLAKRGQRTLLWDLDVEAPGLHRIPDLRPGEVTVGFLDWLKDWSQTSLQAWQDADDPTDLKLTDDAAGSLRACVKSAPASKNLFILPAFADHTDFGPLYDALPWHLLLNERPDVGLALFRELVRVLSTHDDGSVQHILIDSRTGMTDISGMLSMLVPHLTLLIGSYGEQNIHGLSYVRRSMQPALDGKLSVDERPEEMDRLKLIHVVSPVPQDTEDAADRRVVWKTAFGDIKPIEVAWDRRLLFKETLLGLEDEDCAAARAYQEVTERVVEGRVEWVRTGESAQPDLVPARSERIGVLADGSYFRWENRVESAMRALGWAVERAERTSNPLTLQVSDFRVEISGGLDVERYAVLCKAGRAGRRELANLWDERRTSADEAGLRLMVIADSFTETALDWAPSDATTRLLTLDELEARLFDPEPYVRGLLAHWESSPVARTWVRQRVLVEERSDAGGEEDLLEHAADWADGAGSRLWLVLGDYGTGKTTFFERFTYELATNWLEGADGADGQDTPFPIAIDLREFPNAISGEMLLTEHLRKHAPGFRGGAEGVFHLLSVGKAVLLLDAFDEMGIATAGRSVTEQFELLAQLTSNSAYSDRGHRTLITCRTHFFRDQQQVKDATDASEVEPKDTRLGEVARGYGADIDELLLFNPTQISEFLTLQLGEEEAEKAKGFIGRTYDLGSLAPRPVLLDMIVKSLPELWARDGTVGPAGLYDEYTGRWLRDRSGRALLTSPELRERLLKLLAAALWATEDRRIHHRDLLTEVRKHESMFGGLDHERVDLELRTAAFLVRSPDGYYRFSHKSFLEFFLAKHLLERLLEGEVAALEIPRPSPEVLRFFWELAGERGAKVVEVLEGVLQADYVPLRSENALVAGARVPEGLKPFRVEGAKLEGAELGEAWLEGVELPAVNFRRAQLAMTTLEGALLLKGDLSLAGLEMATLNRADLSESTLVGVRADFSKWRGARLEMADLGAAKLDGADLEAADLTDARAAGIDLQGANLKGARLIRTDLRRSDLSNTQGLRTDLTDAKLQDASLRDSVWRESVWTRANLLGADVSGWIGIGDALGLEACRMGRLPESDAWVSGGNGSLVAAISADGGTVGWGNNTMPRGVWNLATGSVVHRADNLGKVANIAVGGAPRALFAGTTMGLILRSSATGDEWAATPGGPDDSVTTLQLSPDGSRLAVATTGGVHLLRTTDGSVIATQRAPGKDIRALTWQPQSGVLGYVCGQGTICLWAWDRTSVVRKTGLTRVTALATLGEWQASMWAVGLANGKVQIWDSAFGGQAAEAEAANGAVLAIGVDEQTSGLRILTAEGDLVLWPGIEGANDDSIVHAVGPVTEAWFSHGADRLVLRRPDGNLTIVETASGRTLARISGLGTARALVSVGGGYFQSLYGEEVASALGSLIIDSPNRHTLPLAPFADLLHSPEHVRAALNGDPLPPRPPELGDPAHAWNGEEWIVGKNAPLPDDP